MNQNNFTEIGSSIYINIEILYKNYMNNKKINNDTKIYIKEQIINSVIRFINFNNINLSLQEIIPICYIENIENTFKDILSINDVIVPKVFNMTKNEKEKAICLQCDYIDIINEKTGTFFCMVL